MAESRRIDAAGGYRGRRFCSGGGGFNRSREGRPIRLTRHVSRSRLPAAAFSKTFRYLFFTIYKDKLGFLFDQFYLLFIDDDVVGGDVGVVTCVG